MAEHPKVLCASAGGQGAAPTKSAAAGQSRPAEARARDSARRWRRVRVGRAMQILGVQRWTCSTRSRRSLRREWRRTTWLLVSLAYKFW